MTYMSWEQCPTLRSHPDLPKGVKIIEQYIDSTGAYMGHIVMGPFSINGYVTLPPDHPWLDDDTYPDDWRIPADVHGGITYREGSTIGFDTAHAGDAYHPDSLRGAKILMGDSLTTLTEVTVIDAPYVWTREDVLRELNTLAKQAQEAYQ